MLLIPLGGSLALQAWSAGAKARSRVVTAAQTALALPAQQELTSLKEEVGANLARVRAGNGWCFNDAELADLVEQKERFVGLIDYLKPREQAHLILSVEVAYQVRAPPPSLQLRPPHTASLVGPRPVASVEPAGD